MIRARVIMSLAVAVLAASCARGLHGPSIDTPASPAPREIDELSVAERRALLDRAEVWRPIDTDSLDLLRGPGGPGAFAFDEGVACDFAFPDEPLGGLTPKFECAVAKDDVVKVKFGEENGEVYAEVAASRLLWALGFAADRMYPVRVTCRNCPKDPFAVSTSEWRLGRPGNVQTMVFDPATIERPIDGEKIEVKNFEGWSWQELEEVADNNVGASRTHIDALKLLAVFIQHVDSKPQNQALICPDGAMRRDRRGNESCARPLLVVKDLGSSFAAASRIRHPKMKLESWRSADIWKDEKRCQGNLTGSIIGTMSHPTVSEAGRKFLADRLMRLSDRQIRDMFTAARVDRRKDNIEGRQVTADDWVRVFKEKRDQIVNHRCPTT